MQQFANPVLDAVGKFLALFGEDAVAIIVVTLFLWCIDKRFGYRMGIVLVGGTVLSSWLKLLFKVPRPWERNVEGYMEPLRKQTATGYSFPSGHTQVAFSNALMLAKRWKKGWTSVLMIAAASLVGLSRIYCRVHTWQDVAGGLALALLCVFGLDLLVRFLMEKRWGMLVFLVPAAFLMVFWRDADLYKACGMLVSVCAGYCIENNYIRYEVKAKWWVQILKMILGVGLVLAVRIVIKKVFGTSIIVDFIRYAVMGLLVSAGCPWLFQKLFGKIK